MMRGIRWIAAWIGMLGIWMSAGALSSCHRYTEPEQIYPVSAIGFDGVDSGVRVTVEIPVVGGETLSDSKAMRFSQTGADVRDALRSMETGLPRALIFSHCALAVLGDSLSKEQMQEIFAFAGVEDGLPLAAEVVICPNAEQLLAAQPLSSIAVGYEIPQILEQERERRGAELPCEIYQLRAIVSPDLPVAIPRLDMNGEGEGMSSVRFAGLDILRPHDNSYRLAVSDCTPYAILTDTCTGGVWDGGQWRMLQTQVRVDENGQLQIFLRLEMTGGRQGACDALAAELKQSTEELYRRVREDVEEDLFLLEERMARQGLKWEGQQTVTVHCEVVVK